MSKEILILLGSPRRGGNSERLAEAFAEGARLAGHRVELVPTLSIGPCTACDYCRSHAGSCVQQDEMQALYPRIQRADILVFASPVYYYGLSAQIKCAIDRFYCIPNQVFAGKGCILLASAGGDDSVFSPMRVQYEAIFHYLGMRDLGSVTASGIMEKGAVCGTAKLEEAKSLGQSLC